MSTGTARKRYTLAFLTLIALYAGALFGANWLFTTHFSSGLLLYLEAALPALPIIGIFFAIGRYLVEEPDEYIRMLMVRQSLLATGIALSVATIWGFLESFHVVRHVDVYYVAVLWFAGLGVGALVNRIMAAKEYD